MKKRLLGAFIVLFILITSLLLGNTVFSSTMNLVLPDSYFYKYNQ